MPRSVLPNYFIILHFSLSVISVLSVRKYFVNSFGKECFVYPSSKCNIQCFPVPSVFKWGWSYKVVIVIMLKTACFQTISFLHMKKVNALYTIISTLSSAEFSFRHGRRVAVLKDQCCQSCIL